MQEPKYDKDALLKGIENADRNIKIFKDAIKKEKETKKTFRKLIDDIEVFERLSKNTP